MRVYVCVDFVWLDEVKDRRFYVPLPVIFQLTSYRWIHSPLPPSPPLHTQENLDPELGVVSVEFVPGRYQV